MKISNVIFIIAFFLLSIVNNILASSLEYGSITQECKKTNSYCDVVFVTSENKKNIILENYPFKSSIKIHSNNIAEVQSSCGSPCRSSVFIDLKKNEIDRISMPLEFSEKYLVVAYVSQKSLKIKKLFHESHVTLDVDFSPVSVLENAIVKIEFVSEKSIKLTYLTTDEYLEKTKVFSYVI